MENEMHLATRGEREKISHNQRLNETVQGPASRRKSKPKQKHPVRKTYLLHFTRI